MTGKAYYITTLADWQRHAPRFANSHFIVLDADFRSAGFQPASFGPDGERQNRPQDAPRLRSGQAAVTNPGAPLPGMMAEEKGAASSAPTGDNLMAERNPRILVLIEADEGVHLSLEDEPAFEPLPHPLAQKPISDAVQAALAPHGVAPGATTFDAAETLARIHPLLKHRVF